HVLTARLSLAVQAWIREFTRPPTSADGDDDDNNQGDQDGGEMAPQLRTLVHELRIRNQVMYLDPPLENARASWVQQLHAWLAAVCRQRRPQATRYEVVTQGDDDLDYDNLTLEYDPGQAVGTLQTVATDGPSPQPKQHGATYRDLLSRLPNGCVQQAYGAIMDMVQQASSYVQIWLQYQALWDLQTDYVLQFLGEDLARWQSMLLEIRRARSTFDTSATTKHVGAHCVIDYEQVQSKVNAKYDGWQREILSKFGALLGSSVRTTWQQIAEARHKLEQHATESSTTSEVVAFITCVQELKRKCPEWQRLVEHEFRGGQRVLEKQRFQFPSDWMYADQIENEWSAFGEILRRKDNVIQEQLPTLQLKIVAEDRAVDARIDALCADWERSKPVQGSLRPDAASATLAAFQARATRLEGEIELVRRAKEALDMDAARDERLLPVQEELNDLRAVWAALSGVWREIDELRDTPWASVVV
ncbi:dynein heavy chain, partial [Coemansia sp. RSA 2440]